MEATEKYLLGWDAGGKSFSPRWRWNYYLFKYMDGASTVPKHAMAT